MGAGKTPKESETWKTEIVFPNDTNPLGVLNGGRLIQWMDTACAITAQLHTGLVCVTVGIEAVHFEAPAQLGDIITIHSTLTRVFRTSLEIRAIANGRRTKNQSNFYLSKAYFTFVASSAMPNQQIHLPELRPTSQDEQFEYAQALKRKELRAQSRNT